ncbi:hypothetical protein WH52_07085 [Tenacibaculum holothuriorum]|uniref:DUF4136 domain-containing protein n=1 Tax=Tenacibaculum holothuriorum TaxID=1635173 RepID=A0A1Y2PFL3_9FLAO|nr:DUF4136 domain-containing protein [Tenacibaculum holothuriorum]OSY88509.1 hypothetical protein WH52_07085 [Tenacibaculum holothuriorum]
MKKIVFALLILCIGCSTPKVVYDYDSKTNFSKYTTFDYFEDAGEGLSELDKKRIERVITSKLKLQEITRNTEKPSFYVNYLSKQIKVDDRPRIGVGIGGGGNVGFGISGGIPVGNKEVKMQLTVDFVEADNNQLFWQGIVDKKLKERTSPQERDLFFNEVLTKIMEGYPPKKK